MAKKLWGGRFGKQTDPLVEEFTRSIQFDYKIALADVLGSITHVAILEKSGYLTLEEANKLVQGLAEIHAAIENKKFKFDPKCEDIHTNIQNILQKKTGELALKLHTARSRNEQVVFAVKLYSKLALAQIKSDISNLALALEETAGKNDLIIPGFTHLQHAQPVYLKDYFGAYIEMLKRDASRLEFISQNIKMTMGAGALAGTPINADEYNIKSAELIKELQVVEFNLKPTSNSLDSVSDRDFLIDILSALSITGMHLSRLSEDLILWATKEFDFVEIDESFCTGSSLMPQKKNPDVLELARGYAGRLYGNLISVLAMMKGLPLTYNRDMQLDKEPLFNSLEIVSQELNVLAGLVKTLKFNEEKINEYLKDESLYATDLVYYLVDKKTAFKQAHTIVGRLVKYSLDNKVEIKDMAEGLLKKFSDKFVKKEILKLFDPLASVKSKRSINRNRKQ
ncbi:MAG: argininosuccinate lyase [Candidatus Omnitrophica bacterium]|nr:argininosuccinate lyase [Candidatus Omnitrophota bacterium]